MISTETYAGEEAKLQSFGVGMVFAKSLDKTLSWYTDRTDDTVCEAFRRMTEKFRSLRESPA